MNIDKLNYEEFTHFVITGEIKSVSTGSFSLEREGWDEGDVKSCFYSPRQLLHALLYLLHPCSRHPNPLQRERALSRFVTHCIYNAKSCVDSYG